MKALATLLLVLSVFMGNAQHDVGEAVYAIKLVEDHFLFDAKLTFDSHSSLFVWKQNKKRKWRIHNYNEEWRTNSSVSRQQDDGKYYSQVVYTDTIGHVIYNDLFKGVLHVRSFCRENECYQYKDSLKIGWKLSGEAKTIGDLACKKASADFRGRSYTAWYAPSIPIPAGPWKFCGLPGLIVQVEDLRKEVTISLKTLSMKADDKNITNHIACSSISWPLFHKCMMEEWEESTRKADAKFAQLRATYPDLEIEITNPERPMLTELEVE